MKVRVVLPATRVSDLTRGSLDRLYALCKERDLATEERRETLSGLVFARNKLASEFVTDGGDPDDAWLTVDGDAGFDAEDILEWIDSGLPVIAAPRPGKSIDWHRVHRAAAGGAATADELAVLGPDLVVGIAMNPDGKATASGTFLAIREGAAHTMLVRRAVFTVILAQMGDLLAYGNGPAAGAWGFFQESVIDQRLLSDDFFFCHVVRSVGVSIYTHVEMVSRHLAEYVFEGSIASRIK